VNDILNALEDDDDFNQADIYLTPPDNGTCSDEDSGGEDDVGPSNLSGNLRLSILAILCSWHNNVFLIFLILICF